MARVVADTLEALFESFQLLIPYDRIGYAVIDAHRGMVVSQWARSMLDAPMCDCLRLLAPNLSGSLSLWRPNDECASGGFDDVFGDGVEVVDSQDAVDLGEEAVE